ncbi:MAG: malate dehydrogenase [Gammaproteobacteria bacterium]|nr:malate dehydrogenase [Gammaproteobacteria bacterium]
MSPRKRVIGSEHIHDARARGMLVIEVLANDIVTDQARETAKRVGIKLQSGPLEKPTPIRIDGTTNVQRGLYRRSPHWMAPRRRVEPGSSRRLGKLTLIGGGGVGVNIAHLGVNGDLAEQIMLIDIVDNLAESIALDLNHARGISRSQTRVVGSSDLARVTGSDVIVVSAGRPRTPGMSRADLVSVNRRVIRTIGNSIKLHAPNATVIVVTNPLDEMTVEMLNTTGFARGQVLGMAGTLDGSRFRYALARAANVLPQDVEAITLGSHGDEMTPIVSKARIKGQSVERFLSVEEVQRCVQDTITGGAQVVSLKKTGSAVIAPAHAVIEVIDHIRGAKSGSVPISVMLNGEFGISDVVLGVPCQLGMGGLLKVDEITLSDDELVSLRIAADAIKHRLSNQSH